MAKLPEFDFRLQRSDDQPPEYSLEFSVHDGAVGVLNVARPGGASPVSAATAGEARRLSMSQLQGSRFEVRWESGARRIAYGLHALVRDELDHLVPGTWYSLRPERRDGPRRLELARPKGSFGLARLDPDDAVEDDSVTDERHDQVAGAVELTVASNLDQEASPAPVEPPVEPVDEPSLGTSGGLLGPTGGALVRHLRRRQARDAREIARLRVELRRLHKLLKEAGVSP